MFSRSIPGLLLATGSEAFSSLGGSEVGEGGSLLLPDKIREENENGRFGSERRIGEYCKKVRRLRASGLCRALKLERRIGLGRACRTSGSRRLVREADMG